jgi:hypothetical protein
MYAVVPELETADHRVRVCLLQADGNRAGVLLPGWIKTQPPYPTH